MMEYAQYEIYTFSLKCTPNNQILDYGIFKDSNDGKFLEKCILTTIRDKKNEKLIAFNCLPLLDVTLKNKPIYLLKLFNFIGNVDFVFFFRAWKGYFFY